jgi:amino acid permease
VGSKNTILGSNPFWIFLIAVTCVFPLTIFRKISALDKFAAFATVFLLALPINSIYWLAKDVDKFGFDPAHEFQAFNFKRWGVLISAFSVNCMAYNCHINLFSCLEHLKNCTAKRSRIMGAVTIGVVFCIYNVFGISTYLDKFDDLRTGSALEHYDPKHPMVIIATLGVVACLLSSAPLVCWGARNSLITLIWKDRDPGPTMWVLIGGLLCITASFLGACSDNIILFFDLVGGIFSPVLILCLPGLFYLKCVKDRGTPMTIMAWVNICATALGIGVCGYQAMDEIIKSFRGKK